MSLCEYFGSSHIIDEIKKLKYIYQISHQIMTWLLDSFFLTMNYSYKQIPSRNDKHFSDYLKTIDTTKQLY